MQVRGGHEGDDGELSGGRVGLRQAGVRGQSRAIGAREAGVIPKARLVTGHGAFVREIEAFCGGAFGQKHLVTRKHHVKIGDVRGWRFNLNLWQSGQVMRRNQNLVAASDPFGDLAGNKQAMLARDAQIVPGGQARAQSALADQDRMGGGGVAQQLGQGIAPSEDPDDRSWSMIAGCNKIAWAKVFDQRVAIGCGDAGAIGKADIGGAGCRVFDRKIVRAVR